MFRVGQKVVCVDADFSRTHVRGEYLPTKASVYTIREIGCGNNCKGVRLVEIVNRPRQYSDGFQEANFLATRFRPIVSHPTSIAVFEEILRTATRTDEVTAHG